MLKDYLQFDGYFCETEIVMLLLILQILYRNLFVQVDLRFQKIGVSK